jgi:hypothetical protein
MNDAASYGDEHTGAGAWLDLDPTRRSGPFALQLPVIRGSFVIDELLLELEQLIADLESSLIDEDDAPIGIDGVRASWTWANSAACRTFADAGTAHLPRARLDAIAAWNRSCRARRELLAGTHFVPLIQLFREGAALLAGVVWSDRAPVLLPRVDRVFVGGPDRDRRFSRAPGVDVRTGDEIRALLAPMSEEQADGALLYTPRRPERELRDWWRTVSPSASELDDFAARSVPLGEVIDSELHPDGRSESPPAGLADLRPDELSRQHPDDLSGPRTAR